MRAFLRGYPDMNSPAAAGSAAGPHASPFLWTGIRVEPGSAVRRSTGPLCPRGVGAYASRRPPRWSSTACAVPPTETHKCNRSSLSPSPDDVSADDSDCTSASLALSLRAVLHPHVPANLFPRPLVSLWQERQELEHALRERLQVAAAEAEQEAQDQGRHFAEQLPQYRRDADYWNQQKLSAQRSSNFAGARSHSSMHSKCLHLVALAEQHRISPVVGMPGQEPAAEDPDNRPPHAHSSEVWSCMR